MPCPHISCQRGGGEKTFQVLKCQMRTNYLWITLSYSFFSPLFFLIIMKKHFTSPNISDARLKFRKDALQFGHQQLLSKQMISHASGVWIQIYHYSQLLTITYFFLKHRRGSVFEWRIQVEESIWPPAGIKKALMSRFNCWHIDNILQQQLFCAPRDWLLKELQHTAFFHVPASETHYLTCPLRRRCVMYLFEET